MGSAILLNAQGCDRSCINCYENPMRDAGNTGNHGYDFDAIVRALEANTGDDGGHGADLFGGEPLIGPISRVEELLRYGHERSEPRRDEEGNRLTRTGVQSGGAVITDEHIRMFRWYETSVGISLDGPDSLSDLRWKGSLEKTRAATAVTEANISKLLDAGIEVSLIVCLHTLNIGENLPRLKDWILSYARQGLKSCRLHVVEINSATMRQYAPTPQEYLSALVDLIEFEESESDLGFGFFDTARDIRELLLGGDHNNVTCVYRGCDPYNTPAVYGVGPDGDVHNCGMANDSRTGIDWQKADTHGFDRDMVLYNTPQEYGGCKGCRFFVFCRGHCPGSAIDHDWRNRTEWCEVYKGLFSYMELKLLREGEHPLSLAPDLAEWEEQVIAGLSRGEGRLDYHGNGETGLQASGTGAGAVGVGEGA